MTSIFAKNTCHPSNPAVQSKAIEQAINNTSNLGPVRDQGSLGYCFSYASADLYEDWLVKKGSLKRDPARNQLSSFGLGLDYLGDNWKKKKEDYALLLKHKQELIDEFHLKDDFYKKNMSKLTDEQKKQLTDRLSTIIEHLNMKTIVPEGGKVKKVLDKVPKNICLERELSIDDDRFTKVFDNYKDTLPYLHHTKNNARFALGFLYLHKYDPDRANRCLSYQVLQELYPNLSNKESLLKVFNEISASPDFYNKLVERSCRKKNFPKPKVKLLQSKKRSKDSYHFPITDNQKVLDTVDEQVDKGGIASVSFRANLLKTANFDPKKKDFHAALITGKTQVCGEDYYIIRNSYGPKSCNYARNKYIKSDPKVKEATMKVNVEESNCTKKTVDTYKSDLLRCGANRSCKDNAVDKYIKGLDTCRKKKEEALMNVSSSPYFCDNEGNYIVKKDHIKRGIYETNYISN